MGERALDCVDRTRREVARREKSGCAGVGLVPWLILVATIAIIASALPALFAIPTNDDDCNFSSEPSTASATIPTAI